MKDLRKAELALALSLGIVHLHWFLSQMATLTSLSAPHPFLLMSSLVSFVMDAPLPILMALLSFTKFRPSISLRMRRISLGTALVVAVFVAIPNLAVLANAVYKALPYFEIVRESTMAGRIWVWAHNFLGSSTETALNLASYLALIWFLLLLTPHQHLASASNSSWDREVRLTAQIALVVAVLSFVSDTCFRIYFAVQLLAAPNEITIMALVSAGGTWGLLRQALVSFITLSCWTATTWIVYRGVRRGAGKISSEHQTEIQKA